MLVIGHVPVFVIAVVLGEQSGTHARGRLITIAFRVDTDNEYGHGYASEHEHEHVVSGWYQSPQRDSLALSELH